MKRTNEKTKKENDQLELFVRVCALHRVFLFFGHSSIRMNKSDSIWYGMNGEGGMDNDSSSSSGSGGGGNEAYQYKIKQNQ